MNMGIYKIENILNKKVYIGSSVNLKSRKRKHFEKLRAKTHENSYLQYAFNKYGEENFKFEVIEYVSNRENILNREQYWMDKLNVCNRNIGYNILPTAGNNLGYKPTEETREKLRQISLKNGNRPPSQKGKKFSEEHKNKISESHKGKKMSREAVEKSRLKRIGIKLSQETKNKISISLKGRSVKNKKKVINLDTKEIFSSMTDAAKSIGVSHTAIFYCCSGKYKKSGNFRWTYYNEGVL